MNNLVQHIDMFKLKNLFGVDKLTLWISNKFSKAISAPGANLFVNTVFLMNILA